MPSDQDTIAEVNEIARGLWNKSNGFRFDASPDPELRGKWKQAVMIHKRDTGNDASIDEANARALNLWNLSQGFRFDMAHAGELRRKWEEARVIYQERTGIDVLDAIVRHEAALRSLENAPQLYVERRR